MSAELKAVDSLELSAEDQARARFYALIGRLFYGASDSDLLEAIGRERGSVDADAGDSTAALAQPWQMLQKACRHANLAVIGQEHDSLFIGVGRAEVTPYTSHYVATDAADRHLVALRQQLAAWGLMRRNMVFEMEDHISGVCDVMRFLIEQDFPPAEQRLFFERFVFPGTIRFCDALTAAPSADFYKVVSLFVRAFLEVEKAAFEMIE